MGKEFVSQIHLPKDALYKTNNTIMIMLIVSELSNPK